MPINRPTRPTVIVAAPKYAYDEDDPFLPTSRFGRSLLRLAAKMHYPPDSWMAREFIRGAWGESNRVNDVVLSARAAEIASKYPGRDVICIGRDIAVAFGVTKDVHLLTWWPSWVLGPDRLAVVFPDPATGMTGKEITGAARSFIVPLWDPPPAAGQDL